MSKAVRWQVPFTSEQTNTHYRVDIYDEGFTGTPVQLIAGDSPFTTDEDNSEDYFSPVRAQSGSLSICTYIPPQTGYPSGGTLQLADLLPDNNIARPVRLVSISGSTETIEWQGFLSCESYNQDYTGIPQNISFSLISVLEAMASVYIKQPTLSGLLKVSDLVYKLLTEIEVETGMTFWTKIYYSVQSWEFFNKYINTSLFYEEDAEVSYLRTEYVVSGWSCKDVLEKICQFMGWVLRETGNGDVIFARIGETIGFYVEIMGNFGYNFHQTYMLSGISTINMSSLTWMGTGHQYSIAQGSKKVKVIAKVDSDDFELKLPEFPYGDSSDLRELYGVKYNGTTAQYWYMMINYNNDAYNNVEYGYYKGEIDRTGDYEYTTQFLGDSNKEDFIKRLSLLKQTPQPSLSGNPQIAGAILVRFEVSDSQITNHSLTSGLYCPLLPGQLNLDKPIFKMKSMKKYSFYKGEITMKAEMLFNVLYRFNSVNQPFLYDDISNPDLQMTLVWMRFCLRIGNKYWTGSQWSSTRSTFRWMLLEKGIDYHIPAVQRIEGDVELEVMAGCSVDLNINTLYEVIFKSLELKFERQVTYTDDDRDENVYSKLLNQKYRDDTEKELEFASMQNNYPRESIIMDSSQNPMYMYNLYMYGEENPVQIRPEDDLVKRLANYYDEARVKLDLECAHPTTAPLPLLKLNGINDGKVYLPLSESRDWKTEVCTLTCFECPQEPSES